MVERNIMDTKTIEEKVIETITKQLFFGEGELSKEDYLETLGMDSIDKAEITLDLETHFEVDLEDQELEKIETIGGLVKCIEQQLKNKVE